MEFQSNLVFLLLAKGPETTSTFERKESFEWNSESSSCYSKCFIFETVFLVLMCFDFCHQLFMFWDFNLISCFGFLIWLNGRFYLVSLLP